MASGIPTNRTNIDLPNSVSSEILQKTQQASAVMQLARQITLPGNGVQIPVITGDPEADWVTETGVKPVSNPSLSKKIMQAHKLAVIVPFSNEFRRDAAALYNALIQRLPNALGKQFDKTVFFGPGSTLANFDDFSQVTAQALDAYGKTAYDGLVAADTDISEQGGIVNGYALSPQGRGVLLAAVDADKRPLFIDSIADGGIPRILGAPVYVNGAAYKAGAAGVGTAAGTPDIVGFAGDWAHAMYGTVEGVKIDFAEQATITIQEGTSISQVNLWQRNMFAVRAEIEVGFVAETQYFNALTRAHAAS
jgi:HK97 family phage major capsid protein